MTLDFESDQFLKLLTDALRSGPGSPQWHEAIARVRAGEQSGTGNDEYRLLCQAREHLESGREYRSVRAGPAFTRSVMDAIEAEGKPGHRRIASANIIAAVAGLLLLGTVILVVRLLMADASRSDLQNAAIDGLASKLLGNSITSLNFTGPLPTDWKMVGQLPLDVSHGMRPKFAIGSNQLSTGGVVWQTPITPETPFEIETAIRLNRSTDQLLPEIVVSDSADLSQDSAGATHELVWLLQAGQAKVVLPNGHVDAQDEIRKGPHDPMMVRLRADQESAMVEVDGKRIWAGTSGLPADKPRFVSLRILGRSYDKQDTLSFQSVRVLTAQ